MLSQELAATNLTVRSAGAEHMTAWVQMVRDMLERAKQRHRPRSDFDAEDVSWLLYSIWQGSMLIGKTLQRPALVSTNLAFARKYVDELFTRRKS